MPWRCTDQLMKWSCAARIRTWLKPGPPPLPQLTDLDRSEDGSLDLRQHFSGRFMSAKLEAAYASYTFFVWRPRLRGFFLFLSVLEGILLTKSLLCKCGLRWESYEGWAQVYAFAFLMASTIFMWMLLSPKLTLAITTRRMPWLIPAAVMIDLIGYVVPLALYLDAAGPQAGATNVTLLEDASAMQLMKLSLIDQGAWFTNSIMTFTLLTSLASVGLGVGAIEISLLMPVAILCYLIFERQRFGHQYAVEPSLVPQSLIVYALCTFLTFCHTGSTRQQFIVRIYVQHESDLRVEQLEQEKERLDYERLFALQNRKSGAPKNESDNSSEAHEQPAAESDSGGLESDEVPRPAQPARLGSRTDQLGGLVLSRRRLNVPFSLSSASSAGTSEPELTAFGEAYSSRNTPQVSAGCSSRAGSFMQGRLRARSTPFPNQNAPSSDSSGSVDPEAGPVLSEERNQALNQALDFIGVGFPPARSRAGSSGGSSSGGSRGGRRGGRMPGRMPGRGDRPDLPAAAGAAGSQGVAAEHDERRVTFAMPAGFPGWFARFPVRRSPASIEALAAIPARRSPASIEALAAIPDQPDRSFGL